MKKKIITKKTAEKSVRLQVLVSPEMAQEIEELAEKEMRSVSMQCVYMMAAYLDKAKS